MNYYKRERHFLQRNIGYNRESLLSMPYWEFEYIETEIHEEMKRKHIAKKFEKNSAFAPLVNQRIEIPTK